MRIDCIHGYFKFTEMGPGQLSRFMSLFDLEIERSGDHFTFSDLVDAPEHSIAGGTFLGIPTTETFAGPPWEVMRENGLVYDFVKGLVLPILTVIQPVEIREAGRYFTSNGMLLPGSLMEEGQRVKDYAAFFTAPDQFRYSEVGFE